jgi:hypothetical protein
VNNAFADTDRNVSHLCLGKGTGPTHLLQQVKHRRLVECHAANPGPSQRRVEIAPKWYNATELNICYRVATPIS